jgi:hypothetical protein
MTQGHTPRISPSGPAMGVARLGLSAPVAFSDGVDLAIPFDVIQYRRGFVGDLLATPVDGFVFVVGPGLYLVQTQVQLSAAPTTIRLTTGIASGSDDDTVSMITAGTTEELSVCMNALRLSTETPISASVFAAAGAVLHAAGASGNILSAEMLIVELGRQA